MLKIKGGKYVSVIKTDKSYLGRKVFLPNNYLKNWRKTMNQKELRNKLITVVDSGLSARAIADHAKISYDVLAKYKQGKMYLIPSDADKLEKYLSLVQIPTEI